MPSAERVAAINAESNDYRRGYKSALEDLIEESSDAEFSPLALQVAEHAMRKAHVCLVSFRSSSSKEARVQVLAVVETWETNKGEGSTLVEALRDLKNQAELRS